ncbi:hypothetical protein LWI29_025097 [Acer saccharum]|uniref:Uncharacterized protein n=1 Tax=Acer saccharum TaxID=4024 RepID=A0AA39S051_ACESA|nr:hypothetical protein LWI29_025097 [Acer saccharum]
MNQNEQDCDYQLLKNHHKNLAMQKLSTTQPYVPSSSSTATVRLVVVVVVVGVGVVSGKETEGEKDNVVPGYEYDKGAQRDFYCYGCPNHIHNQRYDKGVEIEEQEPDVEKQSDSFVPLQLKNYPYPIVWIPPKYMKKYNESKVSSDQEIVPHNAKVPWKYEVF